MTSFMKVLFLTFIGSIVLFALRGCYYEICDPLNCEKLWPLGKGDGYYQCVKARAMERGWAINND